MVSRRPNVVVFLLDDSGWGDISVHGNTNLSTPHIDSLAKDGTLLEHFYVCALCAPSRAEFLTGRYFPRTGVTGVSTGRERMNLDETTIAEVFKRGGYETGIFGKWHNGTQYPYHPCARGFDEFIGFASGHWSHYFDPTLEHNGKEIKAKGYITDFLTDSALDFISKNREKPFFCYVPYNVPHSPFQVPEKWHRKFKDAEVRMRHRDPKKEDIDTTRVVLAMMENVDYNVGRVLDRLRELDLDDDTIVVFYTDNGPNTWRWNGGMKGKKGWTDEGGLRVPCLIRWPGVVEKGKRVRHLSSDIDLLPTLADLAGIDCETENPIDGMSIAPLLKQVEADPPDRKIFSIWGPEDKGKLTVRTQRYRAGGRHNGLYDMEKDPGQRKDLSHEMPELKAELEAAMREWWDDVKAGIRKRDDSIPVGYPEFPVTTLPARDGKSNGTIKRSSVHPNASFFHSWSDQDDKITWKIDVANAGTYEATVLHTCPEDSVGSEVELFFGNESAAGKTSEPWDPPLKDKQDLVKRSESYEKDFKPLKLGTIRLSKGKGPLELRCKAKPGPVVIDVRSVILTLMD